MFAEYYLILLINQHMSKNSSVYFMIPIDEITDEIVSHMTNSTVDNIRKSIRPIDEKIHG